MRGSRLLVLGALVGAALVFGFQLLQQPDRRIGHFQIVSKRTVHHPRTTLAVEQRRLVAARIRRLARGGSSSGRDA